VKLKFTLHRSPREQVDLMVTADATATVGAIAEKLARHDPASTADQPGELTLAVAPPPTFAGMLRSVRTTFINLDPKALIADAPFGSGFTVKVAVRPPSASRTPQDAAAVLLIRTGPEAGRRVPLPEGSTVVGRTKPADVLIADPLISRQHARIEVGQGIEVIDLNSANGILVDGGEVQRLKVLPGQVLSLGGTEIALVEVPRPAANRVAERGGTLVFNRSPRVEDRYPGQSLKHPAIPAETDPPIFPWPMIVAPILLGLAMYAMTHRPTALLMVAMSPLMMLGNMVGQRTRQGRKARLEIERFEEQIEKLEDTLASEQVVERRMRRAESPSTSQIFSEAMRLGPLLWTRRPEHWNFLALRLGVGTARSRTRVEQIEDQRGIVRYARMVDALAEKFTDIHDVPIIELLPYAGALGIVGSMDDAADIARGIAVQIFGLHAPGEVVATAVCDPRWTPELDWLKWLPHTTSPRSPFREMALADSQSAGTALLSGLEEICLRARSQTVSRRGPLSDDKTSMRLGENVGRDSGPTVHDLSLVLFTTHDAPVDRARLSQVMETGPESGVYTVFAAPTVESLPAACRTFIDARDGLSKAKIGSVRAGRQFDGIAVEGVSRQHAETFARQLSPVVDASTVEEDSSDLPSSVALLQLVGGGFATDPDFVVERWRQNGSITDRTGAPQRRLRRAGGLKCYVGQGGSDAMSLDLRSQGPHALVGGTTGSGKSEFLQAWVLAMACEYSPDRLTFLFVDYKGGAAFADCVDLPHCVGLVTDLSTHLVRRALTSLRAELRHREHILNRKKAKDLLELEKRQDPETPPALVLVIDEFAALATEVPEFVDGVVDIAQRGRSLGIHLIMATQRPAGVIKDNLRANTNLRVALRMADEHDSADVVGDKVAASFPQSLPGRAIAKIGPGRLIPFQSGYAGGWTAGTPEEPEVSVAELRFGAPVVWEEEPDTVDDDDENLGPNDQRLIVDNLRIAATNADLPAPRRPWLDELPAVIDLATIGRAGDGTIPFGLIDVPDHQRQDAVTINPDVDGHLLVYGTTGSGKSALLRTIATAAATHEPKGNARVYGIDCGGGALRSVEALPQVGSIVPGDDAERVQRLLRTLRSVLDQRAQAFAQAHAGTLTDYRELTGDQAPRYWLLLDGLASFRSEWETRAPRSSYYQLFMRLLAEGRPFGIHVVVTADRSGTVPTALSANVSRRVVMRMADATAYAALGVPRDILDDTSGPGRVIVDGLEAQVAVVGGSRNVADQGTALAGLAQDLAGAGTPPAPPIGALPTRLELTELPRSIAGQPVIGISDEQLAPHPFEPQGTFVVAGPPRSGRSNALRALVAAVVRLDPMAEFYHLGGRKAALREWPGWTRTATSVDEVRSLAKELVAVVTLPVADGRTVVVVENVPDYVDSDAERPLKELFQAVNRGDHLLFGDGDVSQLGSGYGMVGELKGGRRGVALRPDANDGDSLFKLAFPRVRRDDYPEGRGIFVENGRFTTVQLPWVDPAEWRELAQTGEKVSFGLDEHRRARAGDSMRERDSDD